ncbi:MAG: hypothetical protein Q4C56_03985 [Peptococcaceae bacterium]|nr:hypothetical protein [Peptococcaceae bacterium]
MAQFDYIIEVEKFNPYHDALGRFATAGVATSFTWKPGASAAHDAAIAREKAREEERRSQAAASFYEPAKFVPAKTMDEAIAQGKSFTKSGNFTVEGMHLNTINAFNEAMFNVEQRFHQKLPIQGVKPVKKDFARHMQAGYDPQKEMIMLKGGMRANAMSTYTAAAEKNYKSGWSASKDPMGTFYHEIGHAVYKDLPKAAKDEIHKIFRREKHNAYLKWKEDGEKGSQIEYFQKTLSRYGATDEHEFFSEAFSQIMSKRARPVSREVNRVLKKHYAREEDAQ